MKKIFSILLILLLAFTMFSCDKGNNQPENPENPGGEVTETFAVTIVSSANGSVTANVSDLAKVEKGSTVTFTVTPNQGYKASGVKINDQLSNIAIVSGKFSYVINAATKVEVVFEAESSDNPGGDTQPEKTNYSVSLVNAEGGSVVASLSDLTAVEEGTAVEFTVTPEEAYKATGVKVNGQLTNLAIVNGKFSLTIDSNTSVEVVYERRTMSEVTKIALEFGGAPLDLYFWAEDSTFYLSVGSLGSYKLDLKDVAVTLAKIVKEASEKLQPEEAEEGEEVEVEVDELEETLSQVLSLLADVYTKVSNIDFSEYLAEETKDGNDIKTIELGQIIVQFEDELDQIGELANASIQVAMVKALLANVKLEVISHKVEEQDYITKISAYVLQEDLEAEEENVFVRSDLLVIDVEYDQENEFAGCSLKFDFFSFVNGEFKINKEGANASFALFTEQVFNFVTDYTHSRLDIYEDDDVKYIDLVTNKNGIYLETILDEKLIEAHATYIEQEDKTYRAEVQVEVDELPLFIFVCDENNFIVELRDVDKRTADEDEQEYIQPILFLISLCQEESGNATLEFRYDEVVLRGEYVLLEDGYELSFFEGSESYKVIVKTNMEEESEEEVIDEENNDLEEEAEDEEDHYFNLFVKHGDAVILSVVYVEDKETNSLVASVKYDEEFKLSFVAVVVNDVYRFRALYEDYSVEVDYNDGHITFDVYDGEDPILLSGLSLSDVKNSEDSEETHKEFGAYYEYEYDDVKSSLEGFKVNLDNLAIDGRFDLSFVLHIGESNPTFDLTLKAQSEEDLENEAIVNSFYMLLPKEEENQEDSWKRLGYAVVKYQPEDGKYGLQLFLGENEEETVKLVDFACDVENEVLHLLVNDENENKQFELQYSEDGCMVEVHIDGPLFSGNVAKEEEPIDMPMEESDDHEPENMGESDDHEPENMEESDDHEPENEENNEDEEEKHVIVFTYTVAESKTASLVLDEKTIASAVISDGSFTLTVKDSEDNKLFELTAASSEDEAELHYSLDVDVYSNSSDDSETEVPEPVVPDKVSLEFAKDKEKGSYEFALSYNEKELINAEWDSNEASLSVKDNDGNKTLGVVASYDNNFELEAKFYDAPDNETHEQPYNKLEVSIGIDEDNDHYFKAFAYDKDDNMVLNLQASFNPNPFGLFFVYDTDEDLALVIVKKDFFEITFDKCYPNPEITEESQDEQIIYTIFDLTLGHIVNEEESYEGLTINFEVMNQKFVTISGGYYLDDKELSLFEIEKLYLNFVSFVFDLEDFAIDFEDFAIDGNLNLDYEISVNSSQEPEPYDPYEPHEPDDPYEPHEPDDPTEDDSEEESQIMTKYYLQINDSLAHEPLYYSDPETPDVLFPDVNLLLEENDVIRLYSEKGELLDEKEITSNGYYQITIYLNAEPGNRIYAEKALDMIEDDPENPDEEYSKVLSQEYHLQLVHDDSSRLIDLYFYENDENYLFVDEEFEGYEGDVLNLVQGSDNIVERRELYDDGIYGADCSLNNEVKLSVYMNIIDPTASNYYLAIDENGYQLYFDSLDDLEHLHSDSLVYANDGSVMYLIDPEETKLSTYFFNKAGWYNVSVDLTKHEKEMIQVEFVREDDEHEDEPYQPATEKVSLSYRLETVKDDETGIKVVSLYAKNNEYQDEEVKTLSVTFGKENNKDFAELNIMNFYFRGENDDDTFVFTVKQGDYLDVEKKYEIVKLDINKAESASLLINQTNNELIDDQVKVTVVGKTLIKAEWDQEEHNYGFYIVISSLQEDGSYDELNGLAAEYLDGDINFVLESFWIGNHSYSFSFQYEDEELDVKLFTFVEPENEDEESTNLKLFDLHIDDEKLSVLVHVDDEDYKVLINSVERYDDELDELEENAYDATELLSNLLVSAIKMLEQLFDNMDQHKEPDEPQFLESPYYILINEEYRIDLYYGLYEQTYVSTPEDFFLDVNDVVEICIDGNVLCDETITEKGSYLASYYIEENELYLSR